MRFSVGSIRLCAPTSLPSSSSPPASRPRPQAHWLTEDSPPLAASCYAVDYGEVRQIAILCSLERGVVTIHLPHEGAPNRQLPMRFVLGDESFGG